MANLSEYVELMAPKRDWRFLDMEEKGNFHLFSAQKVHHLSSSSRSLPAENTGPFASPPGCQISLIDMQ
jgi:hypothetical protein